MSPVLLRQQLTRLLLHSSNSDSYDPVSALPIKRQVKIRIIPWLQNVCGSLSYQKSTYHFVE